MDIGGSIGSIGSIGGIGGSYSSNLIPPWGRFFLFFEAKSLKPRRLWKWIGPPQNQGQITIETFVLSDPRPIWAQSSSVHQPKNFYLKLNFHITCFECPWFPGFWRGHIVVIRGDNWHNWQDFYSKDTGIRLYRVFIQDSEISNDFMMPGFKLQTTNKVTTVPLSQLLDAMFSLMSKSPTIKDIGHIACSHFWKTPKTLEP